MLKLQFWDREYYQYNVHINIIFSFLSTQMYKCTYQYKIIFASKQIKKTVYQHKCTNVLINIMCIYIQYRLHQTLQYFERTRTHYEHTEYTIVGVHALMESIYLLDIPNNFLDVIICVHIYSIICQLAPVFNNRTIWWLAKNFPLPKILIYWPEIWTRWCSQ